MGYWSTGNTVYTDDNRYALKGIKIGQYKLELKHKNWFFRTYTTQEDAGEAYSATVATQYFNEAWKPSASFNGIQNTGTGAILWMQTMRQGSDSRIAAKVRSHKLFAPSVLCRPGSA